MKLTKAQPSRPPPPMELKLSLFQALSLDMDTASLDFSNSSGATTPQTNSETTTLNGRLDSLASSRTSLSSSSYGSACSNVSPLSPTPKSTKRVRFEESVSWSYFDENLDHLVRPSMVKRPSLLTRSWDRMSSRNSSIDSDIQRPTSSPSPPQHLYTIKRPDSGLDLVGMGDASPTRKLSRRDPSPPQATSRPGRRSTFSYSIQQPLRESAGRKYSGAETVACFRTKPVAAKGDWGDLLTNPRRSALMA